jgi:2,3-bisphosphoglycerate-independent phosphoglycerate mutase
MKVTPALLLILDGFGCRTAEPDNAIALARKPNWDRLWDTYPHTTIHASEAEVGLPAGQMGNSEVGHLNIGAGRVVYQEISRINRAISNGNFYRNHELTAALEAIKQQQGALHIFGLLSDGGVHSHENHIHAMLDMAGRSGVRQVYLHVFLDGRDTPPKSAGVYLQCLQDKIDGLKIGKIATIVGRYYAMDRDHRWVRVKTAYDLLTQGKAEFSAKTAIEGLQNAYAREETDEFVKATVIGEPVKMQDGDGIIFMNFRSDRARELTRTFIEADFDGFEREYLPKLSVYCTLTCYNADFKIPVAFPPERLRNGLGEYLADQGLRQLRIAETEKYAHVTFFFNGGEETSYPGESRIMVKSPDVATYDLKPEMSAYEVTDKLVEAIRSQQFDAIICNFANPDMVGHTGNLGAAIKAIEVIDECLGKIVPAMQEAGGEVLITADHGNAEKMFDEGTQHSHTAHTLSLVPFLYIGRAAKLAKTGALEDVSPTLLKIMALPQPREMTGHPLIEFE